MTYIHINLLQNLLFRLDESISCTVLPNNIIYLMSEDNRQTYHSPIAINLPKCSSDIGLSEKTTLWSVWQCECMTMIVYGNVSVWQCECMAMWVYGNESVWQCECMTMRVYDNVSVWQWECMTMWVYDNVSVWQCECMAMWVYDSRSVWQWECMTMWVYDNVNIWQWECMTIEVYDNGSVWQFECMAMRVYDSEWFNVVCSFMRVTIRRHAPLFKCYAILLIHLVQITGLHIYQFSFNALLPLHPLVNSKENTYKYSLGL